jgi:hypothetical protein
VLIDDERGCHPVTGPAADPAAQATGLVSAIGYAEAVAAAVAAAHAAHGTNEAFTTALTRATEIEPDEEFPDDPAEAHTVHTWSDITAVIDAAAAARLPRHIDELIEIDTDYQQAARRYEKLDDERERLDRKRFADPADAARKAQVDHRRDHHTKFQPYRRAHMDACRDRLPADARAYYDALQQQIDDAGQDAFTPDRQAQAATVSGLSLAEYRELYELQKIPYGARTAAQEQRVDELDGHDRKPPLLVEQAALVYGLSLTEYREMEDLYRIGRHGSPRPGDLLISRHILPRP